MKESEAIYKKVVDLDYPPGNIAVSAGGRVFFTLHPDGSPPAQVQPGADLVHPGRADLAGSEDDMFGEDLACQTVRRGHGEPPPSALRVLHQPLALEVGERP